MSLQRYLAAESIPAASRAFTVNAVGVAIVIVTLVVAGLLLSTWYQRNPDPALPAKADHVLAFFIVRELPPGVAGVLIAAILAATMSSMTSCINSLAGIITTDWLARGGRRRSPEESYRLGRWISLLIGVGATLLAGFAENLGSVLDAQAKVMGAFLGPMLACLVLAVGRRERPGWTVLAGIAAGVVVGWIVAALPVASLWVPPASFSIAMLVAQILRPSTRGRVVPADGK
jgi:SSS family solute:Na+ symporter